jgi:CheY-like chemotaxis protein
MATILIVDDDPDTRDLLARLLSVVAGHRAVTAADGAEALDAMGREPVDLILLDLLMPGIGGAAFLAALGDSAVPVLVCSGLDGETQQAVLAEAGVATAPVAGMLCKDAGFFIDLVDAVSRHLAARPAESRPHAIAS